MLQKYEAGFILSPEIAEDKVESEFESIEKEISSLGGSIINKDLWGKRNFAYPIKKKKEGYYYFLNYQVDQSSQKKIEDIIRAKQNILRTLIIIKKDLHKKEETSKKLEKDKE